MTRRRTTWLALPVLALGLLGGCGDDDDAGTGRTTADVLEELAALEGTLSPELVARAEAEGKLSIYTSNSDLEDLAVAFEDDYDIDVDVYRANSETVLARLLQESEADRGGVDLVESHVGEMELLAAEGLLVPYDSGVTDTLRDGAAYPSWTATRFNGFVMAWNTERTGTEGAPGSWEELADDRWRGEVAFEIGDFDWYMTLWHHFVDAGRTPEEADALFEAMTDGARAVDGHTQLAELLGAGEFTVAATGFNHSMDDQIEAGAPVQWLPAVEPVVIKAAGIGVLRDAPHPAAAALFYEWSLTVAQELLVEDHRIPAVVGGEDPLAGVDVIEVDPALLAEEGERWSRRYQELLR